MSQKHGSSRKNRSLENWQDFGGSLDRFDRNNWRRRGLYEDLSNAIKCGISQVSLVVLLLCVHLELFAEDELYSTRN